MGRSSSHCFEGDGTSSSLSALTFAVVIFRGFGGFSRRGRQQDQSAGPVRIFGALVVVTGKPAYAAVQVPIELFERVCLADFARQ